MKGKTFFFYLLCMCLFSACKEEDYVYPSVLTEFIGAQTDGDGTLSCLVSDDGRAFAIQPREGLNGLKADTLYRTLSVYRFLSPETKTEPTVQLYSCQLVLSMNPAPPETFKSGIKTDPVDIQSIWRSGNYLNMVLLVQVKDGTHAFHFIDEGITAAEDGTQTLDLRLYHDRKNDYEAFTRHTYLSVPLVRYSGKLKKGDRIRFFLNTYEEGNTYREFNY